jgi:hypothetical protein
MIPTQSDMIADGIRYVRKDGTTYFNLAEIKEKYPYAKVHPSDVHELEIDGELIPVVMASDIREMTDWELALLKTKKYPDTNF